MSSNYLIPRQGRAWPLLGQRRQLTWTNRITRPRADSWPVFIIETGNPESFAQLRTDARWWLESSDGQVRMMILIKVNKTDHTIQILKYIPIPHPTTYSLRSQPAVMLSYAANVFQDVTDEPSTTSYHSTRPLRLSYQNMVTVTVDINHSFIGARRPVNLEFYRLLVAPPNSLRRVISTWATRA